MPLPAPPPKPVATFPPPAGGDPDDDDDFEDEEDEMDMYDDEDDHAAAAAPLDEDLNSSPSSSTDDDDRIRSVKENPSTNGAATLQSSPVLSLAATGRGGSGGYSTPEAKRPKAAEGGFAEERRSFSSIEDRRLFQRLWTDDDEIVILQGFYEFTSQRGTTHHAHQHDTGPFYEKIKNRLQLDFTKNQLVEKIRRLKKKYRNIVTRMASGRGFAFKSPHEKATYEISRKIWSGSLAKKDIDNEDDDLNEGEQVLEQKEQTRGKRGVKRPACLDLVVTAMTGSEAVPVEVKSVPALPVTVTPPAPPAAEPVAVTNSGSSKIVEETVKNCFSPLVKDLVQYAISGTVNHGMPSESLTSVGLMPLGFMGNLTGLGSKDAALDGRWRKQQILELEVYSKRLELLQELIKAKLEELRSIG